MGEGGEEVVFFLRMTQVCGQTLQVEYGSSAQEEGICFLFCQDLAVLQRENMLMKTYLETRLADIELHGFMGWWYGAQSQRFLCINNFIFFVSGARSVEEDGCFLGRLPGHVPNLDVPVLPRRRHRGLVHPSDAGDLVSKEGDMIKTKTIGLVWF